MAEKITIICRQPGMRRAGVQHPASATYPADRWSKEQLKAFRDDASFEVIDGEAPAATTQAALIAVREELKGKDDALKSATDEMASLKAELEKAQGNLDDRTQEIEGLKKTVSERDAEIKALKEAAEKAAKTTPKK